MCNNKMGEFDNLPDNIGFDISDRAASGGIRIKFTPMPSSWFMRAMLEGEAPVSISALNGKIVSWHATLLNKDDALYIYKELAATEFAEYLRRID